MQTRRWLSPSQPDTLRNATILLYLNGVVSLLGGLGFFGLLLGVAGVAGGYGIANDRKWGYRVGLSVAALRLLGTLLLLQVYSLSRLGFSFLVNMVFQILLLVLLLHGRSRDYQRIWFK